MIRINLLPKQQVKETSSSRGLGEVFLGMLALLAVLGVIFATHITQSRKISSVQNNISTTERKINALKDVEKKIEEFKAKNKELERRIKVIADLEKKRSGPLFVMDSISSAIPTKAWVDEISSKGNSATIKGVAWNEFTVADFMKSLQKSNYIKNVNLNVIKKKTVNSLPLRSFEISSSLDFLGSTAKKKEELKESSGDNKKRTKGKGKI